MPKCLIRDITQRIDLIQISDIGRHGQTTPTVGVDFLNHGVEGGLRSASNHYLGTESGKRQCNLASESRASAGDDGDLPANTSSAKTETPGPRTMSFVHP